MTAPHHSNKGFTLLELMIVLVVLGVVAAMVAPPVAGMLRSSRLAGATNTLVSDIYYARSLANQQRRTFTILFTDSVHYTLARTSPAQVYRTRALPRGVRATATDTVTFYAWGLTEPVAVTLRADSSSRVLRVGANGSVTRD
ncbi:MAG: GspH/FimT family pseudopilin [Candidatus Eisenbacteria bacterium]|uniref:GspH/FimT family pseudopilin n=1 Tax=Eiseniibacteriota bacterium TaxID=2212470 RepID=A0A933SDG4_UNCEI|nr:GspH/FimT family pseudopilin [Candidatus Eisenbacteria bacterium]